MQKSRKETSLLNNWTIDFFSFSFSFLFFFCLYEVIYISKNEPKGRIFWWKTIAEIFKKLSRYLMIHSVYQFNNLTTWDDVLMFSTYFFDDNYWFPHLKYWNFFKPLQVFCLRYTAMLSYSWSRSLTVPLIIKVLLIFG